MLEAAYDHELTATFKTCLTGQTRNRQSLCEIKASVLEQRAAQNAQDQDLVYLSGP